MKKNENEFSFFQIDKFNLDEEWINQPKFYFKYCKMLENAKSKYEKIKAEVDVVKAELSSRIRTEPTKYGVTDKPTETAIACAITTHKKYKAVLHDLQKISKKAGLLTAACRALDHRKAALENLVLLQGRNYYAEPYINSDDKARYIKNKKGVNG